MGEVVAFPIEQQQPKEEEKKHAPKPRRKRRVSRGKKKQSLGKGVVIPNAGGHLMIGAAIVLVAAHSPSEAVLILFGSLLPDIDHRNSTLGKWNPFTRFMVHRGKCHSLIGSALLCSPFLFMGLSAFLFAYIGCLGHIFGDRIASILPKRRKFRIRFW